MHAERAHYGTCRKKCFIPYVHISNVKSLVSIDAYVWTLKTFPGMLSFECQDIEGIANISSRVSWHFMTRPCKCKEDPLMGKYSLVEPRMVIPYNTIEDPVCRFSCSCLSKRLLRRVIIHISVFISPYELRQTQNVNSTLRSLEWMMLIPTILVRLVIGGMTITLQSYITISQRRWLTTGGLKEGHEETRQDNL